MNKMRMANERKSHVNHCFTTRGSWTMCVECPLLHDNRGHFATRLFIPSGKPRTNISSTLNRNHTQSPSDSLTPLLHLVLFILSIQVLPSQQKKPKTLNIHHKSLFACLIQSRINYCNYFDEQDTWHHIFPSLF